MAVSSYVSSVVTWEVLVVVVAGMGAEPPVDTFPRLLAAAVFLDPPLFHFLVEPSESLSSELFSHMDLGGRVLRFTNWSRM